MELTVESWVSGYGPGSVSHWVTVQGFRGSLTCNKWGFCLVWFCRFCFRISSLVMIAFSGNRAGALKGNYLLDSMDFFYPIFALG